MDDRYQFAILKDFELFWLRTTENYIYIERKL